MSLVKVKPKYQVLIPPGVREKAGVAVGDLLEATVERGKITYTPKSVVDRDLEISLRQMREGKMSPAFSTARELVRHLHRQTKKLKKK
jgi:bifunctional DNA-binding transcriptional regulator/antitoxin component of YhaV-PrlF toxin-antitoxin module